MTTRLGSAPTRSPARRSATPRSGPRSSPIRCSVGPRRSRCCRGDRAGADMGPILIDGSRSVADRLAPSTGSSQTLSDLVGGAGRGWLRALVVLACAALGLFVVGALWQLGALLAPVL